MTATTVPLGCAVEGCGVPRRRHDADDHTYQPPGMGTVLSRAAARKKCAHWIGREKRECGSQVGVRSFIQGPRCPIHDPAAVKAATTTCVTCDLPADYWDPTDPLYLDGSHQCPDCKRVDLDHDKHLDHAEGIA